MDQWTGMHFDKNHSPRDGAVAAYRVHRNARSERAAVAMISRLIVAAIAHQVFDEIASERVDGKV